MSERQALGWISRLIDRKVKSIEHAVSDHLDRAMPIKKLAPDGTAGQVPTISADGTTVEWGAGGGGGGTSDHGLLTGLSDDDHPQYHNDARGDARYWQLSTDLATQAELNTHKTSSDHDGRYYTESEVDTALASNATADRDRANHTGTQLAATISDFATTVAATAALKANNLSDLTSASTARTNLGLGTSAILNVPASGDAASGEVVKGSDTRLSDARTPTTHTHPQSDITNLTTDLAAKAPLASPTFTGTPAAPTAAAGTNTTQVATTEFVQTATGSASSNRPSAYVTKTAAQSLGNGTFDKITFDTEVSDTDSMSNLATNNNRLTFTTAGTYTVAGQATTTSGANSRIIRLVHRNSAGTLIAYRGVDTRSAVATHAGLACSDTFPVSAGDYVELEVFQNSGAALNTTALNATYHATLSAAWVGSTGAAWGCAGTSMMIPGTGTQTAASGVTTVLTFSGAGDEVFDIDGMHSTSSNPDRITCVTPGTYIVMAQVGFGVNATGGRIARILKNGTAIASSNAPSVGAAFAHRQIVQAIVQMSVGDYLQVDGHQNSGSTLTMDFNRFEAVRVGYQTNPSIPASVNAYHNTTQSLSHATWTALNLNSEVEDTDTMHDTVTNNTRVYATRAGVYMASGIASFSLNATGDRHAKILKNAAGVGTATGNWQSSSRATNSAGHRQSVSGPIRMAAGDYVELFGYQDSGGALSTVASECRLALVRIGD